MTIKEIIQNAIPNANFEVIILGIVFWLGGVCGWVLKVWIG